MVKPIMKNVKYEDRDMRGILVSYQPEDMKGYIFKTTIKDIHIDDLVVVPTGTRWGFTVCKVIDIDVPIPKHISIIEIVRVV